MTKYIFVTGGVTSSLGKGIVSASLAKLLQARGFSVTIQKFDPYINVDPGPSTPTNTASATSPTTAPRPTSTSGTTSASSGRPRARPTT